MLFAFGHNQAYALNVPSNVMADVHENGKVIVTWKDNSTDELNYRLQRYSGNDPVPAWRDVASTLGANKITYTDDSVAEGKPYIYRVRAEKGSTLSTRTYWTKSNRVRPLKAPSLVSVTRNAAGQPLVEWNDNSMAETGYVIERRDDGTGNWEALPTKTAKNINTYTDLDISALIDPAINKVFEYRVKAYIHDSINFSSKPTSASGWLPNCSTVVANPWLQWMSFLNEQVPTDYQPVWNQAEPARTRETNHASFLHQKLGQVSLLYNNRYAALFIKGALVDVIDRNHGRGFFGAPFTTTGIPEQHLTLPTIWQITVGNSQNVSPESAAQEAERPVIWSFLSSHVGNPITDWNQQHGTLTFRWQGPTNTGIAVPNKSSGSTPSGLMVTNVWQIYDSVSTNSSRKDSPGVHGRMEVTGAPPANEGLIYVRFPFLNHLAMDPVPSNRTTDLVIPSEEMGNVYRNFPQPDRSNTYQGTLLEGSWQAQFFGLIQDDAALYVGVEDPKHHPKVLYFRNQVGISATNGPFIEMYPESIDPPENKTFAMDYDVVLTPMCVFPTNHGTNGGDDWVRIAKRYRDFATGSRSWLRKDTSTPPVAVKLSDRNDIPLTVRDGLYWWTEWMGAYNQYGEGLSRDIVRHSTLAQASNLSGTVAIVKDTSTNKEYHSLYKEVSPYSDAQGCYTYQESTARYYVFENNVVNAPNQTSIDWAPGTPEQKIYLGYAAGNTFELAGGRALSAMFVGEADKSKIMLQDNIADRRHLSGNALPLGFHTYTWHTPGFDRGNPEYTMIPGFDTVVADANNSCITTPQSCDFIVPYINSSVIDMTDLNWDATKPGNPIYGKYCLHEAEMVVDRNGTPQYLWPSITGQSIGRLSIGSPWWRGELINIASNIFSTIGAPGIYLDTFGGHYEPSFRTDGGDHLRGYGVWYTDRHKQVAKSIKDMATDKSPRLVAAEHGSDAFYADIDMIMLYGATDPKNGADIMPAVYSGYQLYAGTRSEHGESSDGAATKNARHFVSGRQVGLNSTYTLGSTISDKVGYATTLADARLKLKDILSYGEYLGPADPNLQDSSTLSVDWCKDHECVDKFPNTTLPAIRGSRWQYTERTTGAKKRAIVLTNASSSDATGKILIPNSWALVAPQLCEPGLTSCTGVSMVTSGSSTYANVSLNKRSVLVMLF